jgi:hypothetical protein
MESSIYVRANGEIPCGWCGEQKILYHLTEDTDIVNSVLLGDSYNYIRTSLKQNKKPWSFKCLLCPLLEKETPFSSKIIDERIIPYVQIEPSCLCQLDCGACFPSRRNRKKMRKPPYDMPMGLFKKLIDSFHRDGFTVCSFDFMGRGDPLMNMDVWKMVSYTREHFPESYISLFTNGNYEYNEGSVNSGVSELVISADGCFQKSYERYRRYGNINTVFRFMEQFVEGKKRYGKDIEIIWKYILFSHNDSNRELIATQKKAMELEIDTLSFIVTPFTTGSCRQSRYFKKSEIANFPLIDTGTSSLKIAIPDGLHPLNHFLNSAHKRKLFMVFWRLSTTLSKIRGH